MKASSLHAGGSGGSLKRLSSSQTDCSTVKKTKLDSASLDRTADTRSESLVDVATLKRLKRALRGLIVSLQAVEAERVVLERIWYKNALQFKSALWWHHVDSLRRSIRSLDKARELTAQIAALYAELNGAAAGSNQGWPVLPRETKPSTQTIESALNETKTKQTTKQARHELGELKEAVKVVGERAKKTGKTLMVHLNTPPAPTFAPLVTALIAVTAAVHHPIAALARHGSSVDELRSILDQLLAAA